MRRDRFKVLFALFECIREGRRYTWWFRAINVKDYP